MFYEVIPTTVFRQDGGVLTYTSDLKLRPGQIVVVPLGRKTTVGIVLKQVRSVDFPTKPITKVLYDTPLPAHILKSITWLHQYYLAPLPLCANLFLPTGITKRHRSVGNGVSDVFRGFGEGTEGDGEKYSFASLAESLRAKAPAPRKDGRAGRVSQKNVFSIPLNSAQKQAIEALEQTKSATRLLHGITGSGKTNIYLTLAQKILAKNQSVILLVPEIALTSQLVNIFAQIFKNQVTLIHSQQTEAERHLTWERILNSTTPQIVIGPRSALLTPLPNLGLIIIDEAHEPTYSQESPPKYSALRLASYMAKMLNIPCIQGTATPLITDYYLAEQNHALIPLTVKAKTTATAPTVHIIDIKDRREFTKNRYFSDALLKNIERNLANHRQTLIFHNRRGSAPLTICEQCGWQALCHICYLPLTLHTDSYQLVCHTCGNSESVPKGCPECHHPEIIHKGFGTKLLESELKKLFKAAKIARFDGDNLKTETLNANFSSVQAGDIDIIIGTQTVARGLDLPNLATVGVVQADAGLSLPDYAAEERTYHLLTQVTGRVGRGHIKETDVFLQTFQPEHPIITAAANNSYQDFYQFLLKKRAKSKFPPFNYVAKITVTHKTEETTIKNIARLTRTLDHYAPNSVFLLYPTPAFHEQSRQGFTWQLIVRSKSRRALLDCLKKLPADARFTIDPPSLL